MELTKPFKAKINGKTLEVKAVWITDPTEVKGGYYIVTSSEMLRLLHLIGHPLKLNGAAREGELIIVEVISGDTIAVGSAFISDSNDPTAIALRRAVNNYAFMTNEFNDVFDQLRELNKGTLDPSKSDTLNDSVTKYIRP